MDRGMYCLKCFYDLRGSPSLRCPECGHPFHPNRPSSYSRTPARGVIENLALALAPEQDPGEVLRSLRDSRWSATAEIAWRRSAARVLREYLDWTLAVIEDHQLIAPERMREIRDDIALATTHPLEQLGGGEILPDEAEPVSADLIELSRAAEQSAPRPDGNS